MQVAESEKSTQLRAVIRVVENLSRMRGDEDAETWAERMAPNLDQARLRLGSFGEGKALSQVVALCTDHLSWHDLREVGVDPESDPPWKVLQADLVDPTCWSDGTRRIRTLKMLLKLAQNIARLAAADTAAGIGIIDFCVERGVLPDTFRHRLRRHNDRCAGGARIEAIGKGANRLQLYDPADLVRLLTDEERARYR